MKQISNPARSIFFLVISFGLFGLYGCSEKDLPTQEQEIKEPPKDETYPPLFDGFIGIEKVNNVWWFVSSDGERFYSKGINHALTSFDWEGDAKMGAKNLWGSNVFDKSYSASNTGERKMVDQIESWMTDWGFDSHGMHTDQKYLHAHEYNLHMVEETSLLTGIAKNYAPQLLENHDWVDVFSASFASDVDAKAIELAALHKNNPNLLGYAFTDEPPWRAESPARKWDGNTDWYKYYNRWVEGMRRKPKSAAGKTAWINVLKSNYGTATEASKAYGISLTSWSELETKTSWPTVPENAQTKKDSDDLLYQIAEKWYQLQYDALKKHDTNHLVLGDKHYRDVPDWMFPILKQYTDVVTIQIWNGTDTYAERYKVIHEATGKPIFGGDSHAFYTADDSEADRFSTYERVYGSHVDIPYFIGFHHGGFVDDGGHRYGFIKQSNPLAVYENFVANVTTFNKNVNTRHAAATN